MRISLVGMSNIGKSYWSKRIAAAKGCPVIDCDRLIETRLAAELAPGGHQGLAGITKWMGFPADPQYKTNSARYVELEQIVMREVLDKLQAEPETSAVIDTTGSVIYAGDAILDSLRAQTRIVYFEAPKSHGVELFRSYISHPKPVIWGDSYIPQAGETPEQTLKRCYPALLQYRAQRYREIAHVTIPFECHRDPQIDVVSLIAQATGA